MESPPALKVMCWSARGSQTMGGDAMRGEPQQDASVVSLNSVWPAAYSGMGAEPAIMTFVIPATCMQLDGARPQALEPRRCHQCQRRAEVLRSHNHLELHAGGIARREAAAYPARELATILRRGPRRLRARSKSSGKFVSSVQVLGACLALLGWRFRSLTLAPLATSQGCTGNIDGCGGCAVQMPGVTHAAFVSCVFV